MPQIDKGTPNELTENEPARLRKMGMIVLFAGIAIAAMIYAFGPLADSSEGNTLQTEYYKNQELETQRLWGGGGALILELTRLFKRTSTYSIIIILVSVIFAFGCFFRASHARK